MANADRRYRSLDGHHNPARVITFNTAEGWSRDVSEEITGELVQAFVRRVRQ